MFRCPSDSIFVTPTTNAGITQGTAFTKSQCSYGYDNTHGPADDSGVPIAADRPTNGAGNTTPTAGSNSPNHGGTIDAVANGDTAGNGQNLVYIDGHVEWVSSTAGGWADSSGTRDLIYQGSGSGTDTYILQDATGESP